MFFQITINILYATCIYSLVSLSFFIIYKLVKFFHFAHAIVITLGAYFVFGFLNLNLSFPLALILSLVFILILIFIIEFLIYRQLRSRNASSLILLIASIGVFAIIQNLISIFWGDGTKSFDLIEQKVINVLPNAYITDIQLFSISIIVILFASVILFLNKTRLGLKLRAVSSNKDLSDIFGIDSNKGILVSFIIGSILAALAGILVAFDTGLTPTMGFKFLLYGLVAMIIGGVGSAWGLICGALLLAVAQHLGAYIFDSKWMDAIAYIILILFLIWKPLGFSGKQLKKVEI
jgi:branched-chain amino acid transport system permease protein